MTDADLKNLINADPDAKAYAQVGAWLDCAREIQGSLPNTVQPTRVWINDVYRGLGAATGRTVMAKLDAVAAADLAVRDMIGSIRGDRGLDVGDPLVRDSLDEMATAGAITTQEAAAVKALALRKPLVTNVECQRAWSLKGE